MKRPQRRGFTLVELMISATLLIVVLGGLGLALRRGMDLFQSTTTISELDTRTGRVLNRIVREMRMALAATTTDLSTPDGAPKFWASSVDYRKAVDYVDGDPILGAPRRIVFELAAGELDNGVDDNGDGLVDEHRVVLVLDPGAAGEQRTVLANRVSELQRGEQANGLDDDGNGLADEAGLSFDQEDQLITVRLTLTGIGSDGATLVSSATDSFILRN